MSPVPARSNSAFFSYVIAAFSVIALTLVLAASAGAQADTFLNGDGHDGTPANFGAGTFVPNAVAPIPGALSAGTSSVTIGTIRAGSGTGNVTFSNNRLVMIYQSNGVVSAPTSGNQTAYSLTSSTAGHWEFARVQTVAGSILTLTAPLINSYAAGTSQAVAVPEWAAMTVNNAAAAINAPAWNGTSGGIVSFLVSGTANFSAAGTVSANSLGFRGGISYNENPTSATGCLATQYNSPGINGTYAMKGEGFYPAGFLGTTPSTATTQQGRGNYLNAGGGGNCFNASGGGGGNGGQGGVGGNSLINYISGNQPVGGLGGAALTYSPSDKLPLGGGGGAGEMNSGNVVGGGAGGGVVMVRGGTLTGSGNFRANGAPGAPGNVTASYDGAGGGGSGGVVLLRFVNGATCTGVSANGAVGGNNGNNGGYNWTPGGGGAGGKTYVQGSTVACPQTATGGANGTNGGNAYGASAGGAGATTSNATGLATPTIAISTPTAASYQPSATPTISGTSTNNATIYIYVDGVYSGTTTASGAGAWSYVAPSMSNGAHTVTAYSQLAGIDSATANRTFTVDTITPTVSLTAPANGTFVTTTTPTVTFSVTETNPGTSRCIVDGVLPGTVCTTGSSLAALSQGSHTLAISHTDLAGNVGTSATNTFTVDSVAPVAPAITTPAPATFYTSDTTPTVAGTAEANSTVRVFDGVTLVGTTTASAGGAWTLDTSVLATGSHSITATATDAVGNVSPASGIKTIVIDTTNPVVSLTAPANGSSVSTTTPTVTFSVTETNPGTSRCIVDGVLPGTVCTTGSSLAALSQGSHTLAISHTDLAGNVGTSATNTFTVDSVAPVAPAITTPAAATTYTSDTTPTVAGTAEANSTVRVFDGVTLVGTTTASAGGAWTLDTSVLATGSHSITATATDAAGNVSPASGIKTIVIDTTNPVVSLSAPANGSSVSTTTPTVTFSVTETNPGTSRCIVDGVLPGTVCTSGSSLAALTPGSHTLAISHTDLAGNVGTSATNTFTVDTTAPAVSITSPASDGLTIAPSGNLTFTATDAVGPLTTTCQIDGGAVVSCTSPFAFSGLSTGAHTFTVTSTDGAGNSTAVVRSITVDATPPNTNITANPPSITNSTTGTFSFTSTEGSSTFECVIDAVPIASCSSPASYPGLTEGSHTFQVRATDQYGNVDASPATYTWTIDTTAPIAPTISTPASDIYTSDTTPAIGGLSEPGSTVSVYEGVTLIGTAVADGSGVWALLPDPTLSVGSHALIARATDPAGNDSADSSTRTIVVDTAAPTVTLTAPADGSTVNTTTPAISFSVVDANPAVASSCTVDGGAPVVCTSGYTPPALSEGSHTVVVSHTDLAGNVGTSATNTFTVDTTNPVVSLSAPADGSATNVTTPTVTFSVTETNPGTSRCIVDGVLPGTVCTSGSSLAALTPGSHTLAISHTDLAGNVGTSATNTFTVDTTAPAVSITSPASDGLTIAPSGNLTFTATDAVGPLTTTCQIDGGAVVSCTSPFAFSGLSTGAHTFTVTSTDGAGNSTAVVRSITVDATPPNTNITANPPSITNSTTGTFSFTSTEGSSTFECVIDAVPIASCSSPASYPGLTEGSHTFQVRATDQYGNVDASPATYTWTIDTTAPIAPTISTPASDIYTSDTTPAIGGLSEPGSTVSVYEGVTLIGTAVADGSGVWALLPDPTLSVGSHALIARATDPAGNDSADSSTRTIVVDTAAPTVTLTAPADGSTVGTTTPAITFSVVDANPSVASSCVIDGGAPVVCTSGFTPAALGQGSHTIVVSHTDLAGNVGTSATNTFTVDTIAPSAPVISSGPSAPVASTTAAFGFTGEVGATYECYIDSPVAWAPCASPETYSSLSQGAHTFHVRQTDAGGNVSPEATRAWSVDTVGPPAPSVSGPSGTVGTIDATIDFSDTESPVTFMCSLDGAPATLCTSPVNLTGLSDGAHNYEVYAIDALGNSGASTTINWTVDSSLFTAGITAGPLGTVATSDNSLSFTATILPGTTFMCRVDTDAFASCTSPFSTGALPDGAHSFDVYAVNGSQNSPTVSRAWSIDTAGPSVSITAPTDGQTVGPNGNVLFSSSDATGPVTYTCQIDGGAAVSCGSPFVFTGLTDGAHSVTVTATDGVSNSSVEVRNFIVDATPPQTTITANPPAETSSGDATFGFSSSESPSTFECQLDAGPIGPCTSTTNYTGLAEGSHVFSVRAIDQYGNVDQSPSSYSWTVDQTAPVAPSINTPSADVVTTDTTPAVGGLSEPNSTVSVYDGATLIGTATADGSGNWSLSPDPTFTEGPHVLTATATDASGNTSGNSATRTITVDSTNPVASISSPLSGAFVNTASPDITFTATDTNLASVQCSLDGAPAVTCTSPWATSGLSEGLHTVVVLATDAAGRQASASTTFTVDLTNPDPPVITSPGADLVTVNQTPSLAGTAEPNATITIYDNGVQVDQVAADGAGDWSWTSPTNVSEAAHPYTVTATDAAGNVSADSNTRTITVDLTAPLAPVITSPATDISTNNVRPPIGGTAEANALITVYDGATLIGSTYANGSGDWSFTPGSDLSEGDHVFTATATDAADNTGPASAPRTITVDITTPAAPAITTPAANLVTSVNTQPIAGTAEANSTVTVYDGATQIGTATTDGSGNWSLSPDPTFTEGVHTITAWATDAAGNSSVASDNRVITIDNTAPAKPVITSPTTGDQLGDSTPTITGTAEPGSTVDVYDGATLICSDVADISGDWSCTPSTPLTEGDHTLTAKATDPSGNESAASDDVDVTIDVTNPSVSISSPTGGSTVTTQTPAVSFTATDSNLSTVECKVDSGSYGPCTSPWTTPSLSDGSHTVTVRATDQAGNVATAATTFTVDTIAPAAPSITTPASNLVTSVNSQPIAGTAEANSTVTVYDGATQIGTATTDGSGNWSLSPDPTFTEGVHTITAWATDAAGNSSVASDNRVITIDNTAPAKPVITSPATGDKLGDSTPTVTGTAEPGATVDVYDGATLICSDVADISGDWSCTPSTPLAEGDHTLTAKATDPSGNESAASDDVVVTIDLTNPSVSISSPTGGSTVATHTPAVSFTATDSNLATVECKVDSGSFAACTSPWTTPSLADGSHTVTVRATDAAGNVASAATTFTVDTTAPTSTIGTKPNALDNDLTPTFTFTSNDPGATFECRIDSGAFAACTSPFTGGPLLDGSHTFEVRATDASGNAESPAKSYSWTVDATPPAKPVVTVPTAGITTTDNTPTISGTAEANSSVQVFVDGISIGTVTADGAGNWTITSTSLTDGPHSATARATDGVGNTGAISDPVAFTLDTTPPGGTVTELPPAGGPGTNPTFDLSTPDGTATIACALDGGSSGPCSSPFTPTGTLAPGTHTLVVTFTDPAGNVTTRTITFVIAAAAVTPPPDDPTKCLGGGVVITDLFPKGKKATVSGFARADLIGKTVTITYLPTKKAVGTALVKSDGSFSTTFKAPPKKDWNKNTTTYLASAGAFKSKKTKLVRRTSSTVVNFSGGKLTVSGAVTLPLVKGGGATIKAKTGCTGTWKVIGTTKFKSNGAFSFTTPYAGSGVIFVQVNAVIGNPSVKNKKFKTNSFVVPVVVK